MKHCNLDNEKAILWVNRRGRPDHCKMLRDDLNDYMELAFINRSIKFDATCSWQKKPMN